MTTAWWAATFLLGGLSVYIAGYNLVVMIMAWRGTDAGRSVIPLVAGGLGCLAIVVAPVAGWRWLCWLPFVLDPGSVPMLVRYAVIVLRTNLGKRRD